MLNPTRTLDASCTPLVDTIQPTARGGPRSVIPILETSAVTRLQPKVNKQFLCLFVYTPPQHSDPPQSARTPRNISEHTKPARGALLTHISKFIQPQHALQGRGCSGPCGCIIHNTDRLTHPRRPQLYALLSFSSERGCQSLAHVARCRTLDCLQWNSD